MERQWWRELADAHGIRRDDRSSWRRLPGDLKAAKRDPRQAAILTERVRGVFDDLLGQGAWSSPRDWGRPLVTFPEPGAWDVPAGQWHWDNPCELHLDKPRGLFVVSFIGPVEPHGLLPSRDGPLRRPEPGRAAALHADQDAGAHPRGPGAARPTG